MDDAGEGLEIGTEPVRHPVRGAAAVIVSQLGVYTKRLTDSLGPRQTTEIAPEPEPAIDAEAVVHDERVRSEASLKETLLAQEKARAERALKAAAQAQDRAQAWLATHRAEWEQADTTTRLTIWKTVPAAIRPAIKRLLHAADLEIISPYEREERKRRKTEIEADKARAAAYYKETAEKSPEIAAIIKALTGMEWQDIAQLPNKESKILFKRVYSKIHPDHGGDAAHFDLLRRFEKALPHVKKGPIRWFKPGSLVVSALV